MSSSPVTAAPAPASGLTVLVSLMNRHPRKLVVIFLLALLSSFVAAPVPYLGKIIIDDIIFKGSAVTASLGGWLGVSPQLWMLAGLVCLGVLLKLLGGIISGWQSHYILQITRNVLQDVRLETALHLAGARQAFFETMPPSRIASRFSTDIMQMDGAIFALLRNLLTSACTTVVVIGFMIFLDARLTAVVLITMPITALLTLWLHSYLKAFNREESDRVADLSATTTEFFGGIKMIRAFNAEPFFLRRFQARAEALRYHGIKHWTHVHMITSLLSWLSALGADIFLLVGGVMALRGEISFGAFFAFYGYQAMLWGPVNTLLNASQVFQTGAASTEKVMELRAVQRESYLERPINRRAEVFRGAITLENVGFCYHEDEPILRDITLRLAPGTMTALVGQTGSGKSTLSSLLMGVYLPTSGHLRIDDVDIQQWDLQALRENIGVVLQDHVLFDDTLRANVTLGRDGMTDEKIWAALEAAHLAEHVRQLPEGLETRVGVGGARLSGGQKQRLAIARVFLKDPKLLILDEATSALDTETERSIQESFEKLMAGRTSVVIAHRLSTIYRADQIAVLHQGRLVEVGTHEDLVSRDNGHYRQLYDAQVKGMIPVSGAQRRPSFKTT
ncbi:MAG: ABC transporter ATP-binding protein [Burkholderiales bacterium]|nr:ABC transporter ATP-binding protein [Opitutaceae bacterium]